MPKKAKRYEAFAVFWDHVRDEKLVILQNEHKGRVTPDCLSDTWNESFERAYLGIRPHLKKYRSLKTFPVPSGVMALPSPIQAENAHQALMYFLNPGIHLSGEIGVLDSREYLSIESKAMDEEQRLDDKSIVPKSSEIQKELADLASTLFEAAETGQPLKKQELADKLEWDMNKVGRRMERFFGPKPFTKAYAALFQSKDPRKGIIDCLKNGFYNVDGIVENDEDNGHDYDFLD